MTPTTQNEQPWLRLSLIYLALMAFGFPIGVFIHECGHFAAATAFGWNATFYAAFVGWSHSTTPSASAIIAFLLAGVLVDVIFVSTGLFLLAKNKRTPPRHFDIAILTGTLLTSFSIRWSISPVFVLLNSSDEARISSALGLNQWVIPICTLPIGIGIAIYVISVHIRNKSAIPLMTGALGAFCGMGLWVNFVGPALFGR